MTDEHARMCQEPSAAERRKPDAGREAAIEAAVDAYDAERIRIWNSDNEVGGTAPMSVRNRQYIRPMIAAAITPMRLPGGGVVRVG